MFQGETSCHPGHRTWDPERKRTSGKLTDCSFYLIHPFPELQIPYLHFFLLMKKAGLQRDGRRSVRIQTRCLLRSPANLNKAPTEIQSCLCLSVLVVTGGTNIGFSSFKCSTSPPLGGTVCETWSVVYRRGRCRLVSSDGSEAHQVGPFDFPPGEQVNEGLLFLSASAPLPPSFGISHPSFQDLYP